MSILLAAHGTRSRAGRDCVEEIRSALQRRLDEPVRLGWVDVCEPHVADLVRDDDVLVPAFLGLGHHVSVDVPEAATHAERVTITPHLGSALGQPLVEQAIVERVLEAGGPWPTTIIGWAGSSHAASRQQARATARRLATRWGAGVRVELATLRQLPPLVEAARGRGERVGIASMVLAPGFFQTRLEQSGADGTSAPLGAHPAIIEALERCLDRAREDHRAT